MSSFRIFIAEHDEDQRMDTSSQSPSLHVNECESADKETVYGFGGVT